MEIFLIVVAVVSIVSLAEIVGWLIYKTIKMQKELQEVRAQLVDVTTDVGKLASYTLQLAKHTSGVDVVEISSAEVSNNVTFPNSEGGFQ